MGRHPCAYSTMNAHIGPQCHFAKTKCDRQMCEWRQERPLRSLRWAAFPKGRIIQQRRNRDTIQCRIRWSFRRQDYACMPHERPSHENQKALPAVLVAEPLAVQPHVQTLMHAPNGPGVARPVGRRRIASCPTNRLGLSPETWAIRQVVV